MKALILVVLACLTAACTGGDIKLVQHKNPADRFLDAGTDVEDGEAGDP